MTDANLLLGRLDPDHFLGGGMRLDLAAAERSISARIAEPLGMSVIDAADGILRIAATAMSYAVKGVTTERGFDAGSFAMVVYGGAGPLHASAIARELGIRRIVIPFSPGHFSAYGMLFGDLRYDFVRSRFQKLANASFAELLTAYVDMEAAGHHAIERSTARPEQVRVRRYADMRYVGQEHAVTVAIDDVVLEKQDRDAVKSAFDAVHLQRYGTSAPSEPAELVSIRSTVLGVMAKPPHSYDAQRVSRASEAARIKPVFFREYGFLDTPVHERTSLMPGDVLQGPVLVEEHASTTVLQPTDHLEVDGHGNLLVAIGADR